MGCVGLTARNSGDRTLSAKCRYSRPEAPGKSARPVAGRLAGTGVQCAIARQASAQRAHAWAQRLQWSMLCLLHSAAQPRHASAQSAQMACKCSPPLAIEAAASRQMSAHSRSNAIHRAMGFGSVSLRHAVAHSRQAAAHLLHARRHASSIWLDMEFSSSGRTSCAARASQRRSRLTVRQRTHGPGSLQLQLQLRPTSPWRPLAGAPDRRLSGAPNTARGTTQLKDSAPIRARPQAGVMGLKPQGATVSICAAKASKSSP